MRTKVLSQTAKLALQDEYIAIAGSSDPDHIAENCDIFDFEFSDDEMNRIRNIDEQRRYEPW